MTQRRSPPDEAKDARLQVDNQRRRDKKLRESKSIHERSRQLEDSRGVYYVTEGGQRYHYEWCHDCGGEGCGYCDGVGQVRVDG